MYIFVIFVPCFYTIIFSLMSLCVDMSINDVCVSLSVSFSILQFRFVVGRVGWLLRVVIVQLVGGLIEDAPTPWCIMMFCLVASFCLFCFPLVNKYISLSFPSLFFPLFDKMKNYRLSAVNNQNRTRKDCYHIFTHYSNCIHKKTVCIHLYIHP